MLTIGALLRAGMLAQDVRFHSDEALYASFARRMSANGDFLLSDAPLDKPPVALLSDALSFSLLGSTEFAARLPSFFASLITLAAVYALARRLYGRSTALLALLLMALSPFDLAFAATVFLDPMMTMWLVLACLAASRDRWFWAGIALALALATKQTTLVFIPLIIVLGLCCNAGKSWGLRAYLVRLLKFAFPISICALALILWSAARAAPIDFWTLGAINNTPDRLIRANEIVPRLTLWLAYLANVTGFAPLVLLAFIPLVIRTSRREKLVTVILIAFILAVLLAYWLIAFNTYDRYLHTLVPLILMLVAAGVVYLNPHPKRARDFKARFGSLRPEGEGLGMRAKTLTPYLPLIVVLCVLPFTVNALRGQLQIGGDRGQHDGIDQLAAAINRLPAGTVVYDYSLDWEMDFYLGGGTHIRMIFQPTPQALARAACTSAAPSYFATPASDSQAWLMPIRQRGTVTTLADGAFQLYQLDCTF